MKRPEKIDLICNYHEYIKEMAKKILRVKEKDYDDVSSLLSDIQWWADDIYDVADLALETGQRMEDRLKEYRDAIEGLGFIRSK